MGDPSVTCKIEYPCDVPEPDEQCNDAMLGISKAIYALFTVDNCEWLKARDILIIILWTLSFMAVICVICSNTSKYDLYYKIACVMLFALLACVWEIEIVFVAIYAAYIQATSSDNLCVINTKIGP